MAKSAIEEVQRLYAKADVLDGLVEGAWVRSNAEVMHHHLMLAAFVDEDMVPIFELRWPENIGFL